MGTITGESFIANKKWQNTQNQSLMASSKQYDVIMTYILLHQYFMLWLCLLLKVFEN